METNNYCLPDHRTRSKITNKIEEKQADKEYIEYCLENFVCPVCGDDVRYIKKFVVTNVVCTNEYCKFAGERN